ncbi:MAG: hypothetical protein P8O03_09585 [Ilumatobacter sp.]|nr:hypothetical protein [Ilumatobacter sp.]
MTLVHGIIDITTTQKPLTERLTSRRRAIEMGFRRHGHSSTAERCGLNEVARLDAQR